MTTSYRFAHLLDDINPLEDERARLAVGSNIEHDILPLALHLVHSLKSKQKKSGEPGVLGVSYA